MILEQLATLALILSIACGALLLANLAIELYDRLLERIIPDDLADHVSQPRGFEDWWEQSRHLFDTEGEALPPAVCTAADWCAGPPADNDTRCRHHIALDQGQPA